MCYLRCPHYGEPIEVFHCSGQNYAIEDDGLDLLGCIRLNLAISRGIDAAHPLMTGKDATLESQICREIATKIAGKFTQGASQ
jgi:hypothetical protein